MLTEKEKRMLAFQEQRLAMPPIKFIIMYGVLSWGITTALLYGVIGNYMLEQKTVAEIVRKDLWINLITFPLAGVLFGFLLRKMAQRQVAKLKAKQSAG